MKSNMAAIFKMICMMLVGLTTLASFRAEELPLDPDFCLSLRRSGICTNEHRQLPTCFQNKKSDLVSCAEQKLNTAKEKCKHVTDLVAIFEVILGATVTAVNTYCKDCKFIDGFRKKPACWEPSARFAIMTNTRLPNVQVDCGNFGMSLAAVRKNETSECRNLEEAFFGQALKTHPCWIKEVQGTSLVEYGLMKCDSSSASFSAAFGIYVFLAAILVVFFPN